MEKEHLKIFVITVLTIAFFLIMVTGIIKFLFLQPWLGLTDIVLPFAQISFIHDWTGLILILFILIHMYLNLGWFTKTIKKLLGKEA